MIEVTEKLPDTPRRVWIYRENCAINMQGFYLPHQTPGGWYNLNSQQLAGAAPVIGWDELTIRPEETIFMDQLISIYKQIPNLRQKVKINLSNGRHNVEVIYLGEFDGTHVFVEPNFTTWTDNTIEYWSPIPPPFDERLMWTKNLSQHQIGCVVCYLNSIITSKDKRDVKCTDNYIRCHHPELKKILVQHIKDTFKFGEELCTF